VTFTKDGSEAVFRVSSDRNPGEFYLLDKNKKATYLMATREWIKLEQMAEMRPISLTARDGLEIRGYLTVPKGSDGKNLPLIVHPHGGPFGPFDDWGFDPEVQMLANHGYAVMQLNFRGSGNYGREFERSGYQQWGGTMQDDLTDATLWAIKEGIADQDRICIYGASYGAYASAMGIAKEPDLYKCAVGYVGVYDMALMYNRGDIRERDSGVNFLKEALGTGSNKLAAASPTKMADRIKAPIFIVSGGEDQRAPKAHSEALRDALKKAGKPYEWMVAEHEGHGFFKEETNLELYTRMLAFFDKYIGTPAAKPAVVDAK
jgi:dipeptidyl aminopeptidase/acylaminoacyl peptidase